MSKEDNPFGTESSGTDPFGRPITESADSYSSPVEPSAPTPPSTPPPAPLAPPATAEADDGWRTAPAPPPAGQYAAAPAPGSKANGAVTSLVLGIIGLVFCPLLAPVAWSLGRKAERLVDASGGTLGGRGEATAGKVLGIIGTLLMVVGIIVFIALIIVGASSIDSDGGTTTTFEF